MAISTPHPLAVHRCRFVDYAPSAITAVAFPPVGLPTFRKSSKQRHARRFGTLAVGRANGNIELCEWPGTSHESQAEQGWTISKILFGPNPSKVDSLVFTLRHPYLHSPCDVPKLSDLRLFSAGGGSELIEWDLNHGTILRTISSQGGAIWSMAANPSSTLLALGCEDGCIRLLSIEHDMFEHQRRLDRVKCRVLCIAWGPPTPPPQLQKTLSRRNNGGVDDEDEVSEDEGEWSDSWLVTGGSDSCLRKWDVKTGRVLDKMSTDKTRKERTLVWTVGVLEDGTIVSGDSLGMVKFWDSTTCTQLFTFPAHGADVLCLAIGPDGNSVFTSGVDQKVCQFSHVKLSNGDKASSSRASSRWVLSTSKRMHSHDVRALAIWPPYSPVSPSLLRLFSPHSSSSPLSGLAPVLASGGLDASLVLAPCASAVSSSAKLVNPLATSVLSTFEDAYHRRMAYTTGSIATAVHVARRSRLVFCVKESAVGVWKVRGRPKDVSVVAIEDMSAAVGDPAAEKEIGYEKILEMDLDMTTNICASAVSEDGRWLAIADVYETKLFDLQESDGLLKPRRHKTFMNALTPHLPKANPSEGASALCFSPDSSKLVLATSLSGSVLVIDLGRPLVSTDDAVEGPSSRKDVSTVQVLRKFEHHRKTSTIFGPNGRVVRGMPGTRSSSTAVNGTADVNMDDVSDKDSDAGEGSQSPEEVPQQTADSENESDDEEQEVLAVVTRMAFSPDGQWLATTDDQCRTHIFNLDAIQHHTTLPTSSVPVHALGFSPGPSTSSSSSSASSTSILVMAHADNSLTIYDVEARRYPEWARHLCSRELLPKRFRGLHDTVLGAAFNPSPSTTPSASPEVNGMDVDGGAGAYNPLVGGPGRKSKTDERYALFWGATWLCRVKLDAPAGWGGFTKKRTRGNEGKGKKRSLSRAGGKKGASNSEGKHVSAEPSAAEPVAQEGKDGSEEETNFKLVTRYRPILLADFIAHNELIVVERPLVDVLATLPPAFFKPKYGT